MRWLLLALVAVPTAGGCFGTDTPRTMAPLPAEDETFVFLASYCKSPDLLRIDGAGRLVHATLYSRSSSVPDARDMDPQRLDAALAEAEARLGLQRDAYPVVGHAEEAMLPQEDLDGLRIHVAEAEMGTLEPRYANEDVVDGCAWRIMAWDGARHVVVEDVNGGGPERLRALVDFTRHVHPG